MFRTGVLVTVALAWASSNARAQTAQRSTVSTWRSEGLSITVDSAERASPPAPVPGVLSPALDAIETDRDLRVDLRFDIGPTAHIAQQHGIEFVAGRAGILPDPGLAPSESPPLTRFSGSTITYRPLQAFDITLGGRVQQDVQPSGSVPSEVLTHSLALGSTPHPDTRIEFRARHEDQVRENIPATDTQAVGLNLVQRLPGTALRLTLAPEVGVADTTSPIGADASDTARLATQVAWDISPMATWSLGSQFEAAQSETLATERQRLTSGVQFRPAADFRLALTTEYGETRRGGVGSGAPEPQDPERDLRLRLSPSMSLGSDVTARMDIDFGLRDSSQAGAWSEGGGAISFSIGGRF